MDLAWCVAWDFSVYLKNMQLLFIGNLFLQDIETVSATEAA